MKIKLNNTTRAYFKALDVIRSCETIDQLYSAKRYVERFYKLFNMKDYSLLQNNLEMELRYKFINMPITLDYTEEVVGI